MNIVGRKSSVCDIRLASKRVSQVHCMIFQADGEFWIQDLDSSNGTWVNGHRIESDYLLRSGDRIRIANERFTLEAVSIRVRCQTKQLMPSQPDSKLMSELLNEMQLAKRFDFDEWAGEVDGEFRDSENWDSSVALFDSVC